MADKETIKEFLVKLGFDVDEAALAKFTKSVSESSLKILGFGAAASVAALGVVASVAHIAKEYREFALLADQLKTTTSELDEFVDSATILGVSSDDATSSMSRLSKNVADAALGVGRAKLIFERMGISIKDANGETRSTVEVMSELQQKMQKMDRAGQLRVLERLGLDPKMLEFFNDEFGKTLYVKEELGKIDLAAGFNLDDVIKKSQSFTAAWKNMSIEINLLKMFFLKLYESVVTLIMPKIQESVISLTRIIGDFRRIFQDNASKISTGLKNILLFVLKIGSSFAQLIFTVLKVVSAVIAPIISFFMKLNAATGGFSTYVLLALGAWKAFNLGFLFSPLGVIVALGAAIVALVDDFLTFQEGGEAFFGFWAGWKDTIEAVGDAVAEVYRLFEKLFVDVVGSAWQTIKNLAAALRDLFLALKSLAFGDFAAFFDNIFASFKKFIDSIKGVFGAIKGVGDFFAGMSSASPATTKLGAAITNKLGGNVSQQTNIVVNGATNPQATAKAVAAHQGAVNAQITRNMRGNIK